MGCPVIVSVVVQSIFCATRCGRGGKREGSDRLGERVRGSDEIGIGNTE